MSSTCEILGIQNYIITIKMTTFKSKNCHLKLTSKQCTHQNSQQLILKIPTHPTGMRRKVISYFKEVHNVVIEESDEGVRRCIDLHDEQQ